MIRQCKGSASLEGMNRTFIFLLDVYGCSDRITQKLLVRKVSWRKVSSDNGCGRKNLFLGWTKSFHGSKVIKSNPGLGFVSRSIFPSKSVLRAGGPQKRASSPEGT